MPAAALAQEQGEAKQGFIYAKRAYAEYHEVRPAGRLSPNFDAKSFKSVANRPGLSAIAISVWMHSSHETMPHIVPAPDGLNDVITYIVSLKE